MPDLKWRGCGEGSYVSQDGLFLIAQVTVPGKKGPKAAWALYGRVEEKPPEPAASPPPPWSWGAEPLTVWPQKKQCQEWAAGSDYEPTTRAAPRVPLPIVVEGGEKATGWFHCQECGVKFDRDSPKHRTDDYCGVNCVQIVAERLMDIQDRMTIKTMEGMPLRVGPAQSNEPQYRPNPKAGRRT